MEWIEVFKKGTISGGKQWLFKKNLFFRGKEKKNPSKNEGG